MNPDATFKQIQCLHSLRECDFMASPTPRATIIGDGAMGTLCALLLAERDTKVTLKALLDRDTRKRR